ncbi:hypothetical protein COLO4_20364 [Corchorus olitorius]|uniref:Leucine-rich repeat-containing N-terminal plant-type domain-containing protein n=1 Tax=Corchorus olitorius TaxID=93759 RepID=A0A1R3J0A0_9ROSI|nr:hypothetical protein COLO4_20364 [Corchorus olitorius]
MGIWRTPCRILLLSFLLLTKSFFLEAAESHSTRKIGSCIKNERKALLELRKSLKDPSDLLSNWVGKNCCNWTGISCSDDETGNVVKLDLKSFNLCSTDTPLSQCQLGGKLPNSVSFDYGVYGAWVDLGFNLLEGSIPIWPNVTKLSLRNNLFSGPIPSNMGHKMSNVEKLDLSRNFLNGGQIPENIGDLRRTDSNKQPVSDIQRSFHLSRELGALWSPIVNQLLAIE